MNQTNFTNNYQCIQIGFYKLKNNNLTTYKRIKKINKEENLYSDGDNNFDYKNYYKSIEVECDVRHDEEEDEYGLFKTLNEQYVPVFFVKKERYIGYNTTVEHILKGDDSFFQIYVTYGKCEELPDNNYSSNEYGSNTRNTKFKIYCYPKLWKCDEYIKVLKTGSEEALSKYVWGGGANWGAGGINWGDYNSLFNTFADLNIKEKNKIFTCNNCACVELQNLLIWDDIYVRPDSKWKLFPNFELPTNNITQTTLSTNETKEIKTTHDIASIRDNTETVVQIERTGQLNAILKDDSISISNLNNKSGFKITWLNQICPKIIQIRYDGNTVFEVKDSQLIFIEPEGNYTIEATGFYNEGLFFDGTYPIDRQIIRPLNQQLILTHSSASSTSNNFNIKIYSYFTNI